MKVFITYSDEKFNKQRDFAVFMAKHFGKFDKSIGYKPEDIDKEFYEQNKEILSQPKGGGYWLWKPYFIYKTLKNLNDGDYLFYADAGSFFLKDINILIDELEKSHQDVIGFELPLIESQWTKRELFITMNCDNELYRESNHIMGSFHLIKKSNQSLKFYKEYLELCTNTNNITDILDSSIQQNKDFLDHRQDQSIFSLLYKKYKLKPFKDPSQRGDYPLSYGGSLEYNLIPNKIYVLKNFRKYRYYSYATNYKRIIYHYRRGNPVYRYFIFIIKEILYKLKIYKKLIS